MTEASNNQDSDYKRLSSNKTIHFDQDYVPIRLGIKQKAK